MWTSQNGFFLGCGLMTHPVLHVAWRYGSYALTCVWREASEETSNKVTHGLELEFKFADLRLLKKLFQGPQQNCDPLRNSHQMIDSFHVRMLYKDLFSL